MRRPLDISPPHDAAVALLRELGTAAMPSVEALAPAHLAALEELRRSGRDAAVPVPRTRRARSTRRPAFVMVAAAALVAIPSMAVAGVLPDPIQRAAAGAAAVVGVQLPQPAAEQARSSVERDHGAPSDGDAAGRTRTPDASGDAATTDTMPRRGLGEDVRGTVPGAPEPGERRGNRYGQVPGGPDRGRAGDRAGSGRQSAPDRSPHERPSPNRPAQKPPAPAKPALPPGQARQPDASVSTPTPAAPEPASPKPAVAGGAAGGHGAGAGGGRPAKD